jgi:polyhydroxyalkanoate synthesis repressor PhaR
MQVHHLLASCAVVRPNPPKRRAAPKEPKKPARRGRPPRHRAPEAEEQFTQAGARIIKRYGNRRLYDATLRRAVTATEIAEMIRKGEELAVVDADSGADITKRFLVQIILEDHNAQQLEMLPVSLLKLIIRARTGQYAQWIGQYLETGATWLKRQADGVGAAGDASQAAVEQIWGSWGKPVGWPPAPAGGGAAPATKSGKRAADGDAPELRSEMEELQRRMEELASKMKRR